MSSKRKPRHTPRDPISSLSGKASDDSQDSQGPGAEIPASSDNPPDGETHEPEPETETESKAAPQKVVTIGYLAVQNQGEGNFRSQSFLVVPGFTSVGPRADLEERLSKERNPKGEWIGYALGIASNGALLTTRL